MNKLKVILKIGAAVCGLLFCEVRAGNELSEKGGPHPTSILSEWGRSARERGYPTDKMRTFIIEMPDGREYRYEIAVAELVGRFKATLMTLAENMVSYSSRLKILYDGTEIMKDSTAIIGDGEEYLLPGNQKYKVVFEGFTGAAG